MSQALKRKIHDKLDCITIGFLQPECRVVVDSQFQEYDLPAGREIARHRIEVSLPGLYSCDLRYGFFVEPALLWHTRKYQLDPVRRAMAGHPACQFAVGMARTKGDFQQFVEGRGKEI
ncbi:hypothetical protein AJ88_40380 [Mesorhizobium amorphae CCBAU 01583]|nr:hypothetical protein AJ88_40380 [Mesorhizobium amorphae CCBAU 01583]